MAVVEVKNLKGEKVSEIELTDSIFNVPVKNSVLHEVVCMQLASRRQGTASVKNRSDVVGSTKKLFRQKGSGRQPPRVDAGVDGRSRFRSKNDKGFSRCQYSV